ncbi:uncharacterized protein LOC126313330 [Schistocerca gregaria]|uniref:uncharacterized protein LOC126313330 n=1 Tax=Schistocerca gregaria TaxID=7010 RepID=UPI00211DCB0E|nr:uncharacterized protein LOC126313330 [Schistocerca gregaria]
MTSRLNISGRDAARHGDNSVDAHSSSGAGQHQLHKRETASKTANTVVSLIQQLSDGIPPSNGQLLNFLDHTGEGLERAECDAKLNKKGKRFIRDSENLVSTTKKLINEKNNDELAQALLIDIAAASIAAKKQSEKNSIDSSNMKMNKTVLWRTGQSLFNIFSLIYTSNSFKEMIFYALDATDQALAPATSPPDESVQRGETNEQAQRRPEGEEGEQHRSEGEDAQSHSDENRESLRAADQENAEKDTVKRGENQNSMFRPFIKSYFNNNNSSVSLLAKENFRKFRHMLIMFLKGDTSNVDSKTIENIHYHFSKFLQEISQHPKYRNGINDILYLFEIIKMDALFSARQVNHMKKNAQEDRSVIKIRREIRYMLERFIDGKTLSALSASANLLMEQMSKDQQMTNFLPGLASLTKKVANSPNLLDDENVRNEFKQHISTSRDFYRRYSNNEQFKRFTNELSNAITQISSDALLQEWYQNAFRVSRSLMYTDMNGRSHIEKDILRQMKQILLPLIAEQLKYVAIPTISGSDKKMDWTLSQIVFSGYDMLPERVKVSTNFRFGTDIKGPIVRSSLRAAMPEKEEMDPGEYRFRKGYHGSSGGYHPVNVRDTPSSSQNGGVLIFDIEQIRANIQDAAFVYRRKVFPYMVDQGLASVGLRGKGASIRILLDLNASDAADSLLFTGGSVRVLIDSLKMRVIQSKHDRLYGIIFALFSSMIRKQVEYQLSQKISDVIGTGIGNVNRRYSKIPKANVRRALFKAIEKAF